VKEDEEKPKPTLSPGQAFPDIVFEQLSDASFLVFDRVKGEIVASNSHLLLHDGLEYVPLPRLPWPTCGIKSEPNGDLAQTRKELLEKLNTQKLQGEYESEEQLFNEIRTFFSEHLDVSNELLFDVYAAFTLATWRAENFTVVAYAFFLGPLASGKTRALECFHRLCYRAIMAASMSAASLFRVLEAWHSTLLLDETEIYNRESMVEVLALLNSGYRRGQYAIRIEKLEDGCPQIGMFDTFGFKVLAGTEELAATLQSRCIITTMSKAMRHINLFIDEEKAQDLRNKLLMYRFRNLGKPQNFDVSRLNGYFNNARVIELFVSLLHVAPTEEIRERLIKCMKQITQSRLDEEQASLEARVFDAVLKCEDAINCSKISTQAITEAFNFGLPEKEQLKSYQVGRKVAALGFEKCRFSGGKSGFFWNSKHIERLKARYYPTVSNMPSLPSLMMDKEANSEQPKNEGCEGSPSQANSEESQIPMKSEGSEQSEGSEGSLEALATKTSKLEPLKDHFEDKCVICGFRGRMDFQVTLHDNSWALLCRDCGLALGKRLNQP